MSPSERRSEILHLLCKRRHETAINLAVEFGVSERTIRADLVILSCLNTPPETVPLDRTNGALRPLKWCMVTAVMVH